jgi:hypothetical protein
MTTAQETPAHNHRRSRLAAALSIHEYNLSIGGGLVDRCAPVSGTYRVDSNVLSGEVVKKKAAQGGLFLEMSLPQ